MLTKKIRAPHVFRGAISTLLSLLLLVSFSGCQPSGPRSLLLGEKYVGQGEYARALKYLTRAAQLMPERAEAWNLLGVCLHGLQQRPQALEAYQRALRIDRNFASPHYNLGVLMLDQNRLPEAIAELKTFVAAKPDEAEGWQKLGTALLRSQRPDEAERALRNALRINAKDPEALNNLGMAHIQRKRPREAIQAFNAALQARPGYPPALLNQAIVTQVYFGNKQLALERYDAFLRTKPSAAYAVQVRGVIDQIQEELKPAPPVAVVPEPHTASVLTNPTTVTLPKAPESKPSMVLPRTNTAVAIAKTNKPPASVPATNELPKEVALTPSAPTNTVPLKAPVIEPALTNKAVAEIPSTNTTAAKAIEPEPVVPVEVVRVEEEPDFKPVMDVRSPSIQTNPAPVLTAKAPSRPVEERPLLLPRRTEPEREKGGLLTRMNPANWFKKDDDSSAQPITRSSLPPRTEPIRSAPPAATASPATAPLRVIPRYAYRKEIALPAGNRKEAEKFFAQATAAFGQKRWPEAISLYKKAISVDPSYFDAQYNLGLAAYRNKDLPLALAADEQAVALKPNSIDARFNFAATLRDAHYYADAAKELRELLSVAPNEVRAHLALASLYAQQLDDRALARTHYQRVLELEPNHPEAASIRQWLAFTQ